MADKGRPTEKTPEVIRKIEEVAALDGTVEEMAFYANVNRATIYRWLKEDEEFSDRINDLKQAPFLKARRTIESSLSNPQFAFEYMKRKKKAEFSERQELTGADGDGLIVKVVNYSDDDKGNNNPPQV